MPHVIVKLWPGKSERQKARLSEAIVKDVVSVLNYGEESVSVAIEEVKTRGLGREGLQTRHPEQVGGAIQEARLRPIRFIGTRLALSTQS